MIVMSRRLDILSNFVLSEKKSIFRTNMWKEGDHVLFECIVEETGKPCLTGGWIKLSQDLETEVSFGNSNSVQQGY